MISGNLFKISLCIIIQSTLLHTLGLRVFAFKIIFFAISIFANLSIKICTTPAPVSITGIFAFSRTKSIRLLLPRGMQTSTKPFA